MTIRRLFRCGHRFLTARIHHSCRVRWKTLTCPLRTLSILSLTLRGELLHTFPEKGVGRGTESSFHSFTTDPPNPLSGPYYGNYILLPSLITHLTTFSNRPMPLGLFLTQLSFHPFHLTGPSIYLRKTRA